MSNRKDESAKKPGARSRRSLIAGAAVAAALPLVSVTTAKAQARGTRVMVDLGGVELPRQVADTLEENIRRACLSAVAQAAPRAKFKNVPLGPGIRGFVIRPIELGGEQHM
jgi:hypothetical protein